MASKRTEEEQNKLKLKGHKNGQHSNDSADPKMDIEIESNKGAKLEARNNESGLLFPTIGGDHLNDIPQNFENNGNGQLKKSMCSFKEFKSAKSLLFPKKLFSKTLVDEILNSNEKLVQAPQLQSVD